MKKTQLLTFRLWLTISDYIDLTTVTTVTTTNTTTSSSEISSVYLCELRHFSMNQANQKINYETLGNLDYYLYN